MKKVDRLLKLADIFEKKMVQEKFGQNVVSPGNGDDSQPLTSELITLITRPIFNNLTTNANTVLANILNAAVDKAWNAGKDPKTGYVGVGEATKLVANKSNGKWIVDRQKSGVEKNAWLKDAAGEDLITTSGLDVAFSAYLKKLYDEAFPKIEEALNKYNTSDTTIEHTGNMGSKFAEL